MNILNRLVQKVFYNVNIAENAVNVFYIIKHFPNIAVGTGQPFKIAVFIGFLHFDSLYYCYCLIYYFWCLFLFYSFFFFLSNFSLPF